MDFIFDFLLDLIMPGGIENVLTENDGKNKPKTIGYVIFTVITIVYLILFGILMWVGISTIKENVAEGIMIIVGDFAVSAACAMQLKKAYSKRKKK